MSTPATPGPPGEGREAGEDEVRPEVADVPEEPVVAPAGEAEPSEPDDATDDGSAVDDPAGDVDEPAGTDADAEGEAEGDAEADDTGDAPDADDEALEVVVADVEDVQAPAGVDVPVDVPRHVPHHLADPPAEHPADGPSAEEERPGATSTEGGAWHRLGAALRPRLSRSQVLAGVLCAALGFALVVQVQQSASDQLSTARQEDLVRLLDEVTDRAEQLAEEVSGLETTRDDLISGSGRAQSALELAQERAESEGILSGRLPAEGPGVRILITDRSGVLEAAQMFNVLEELRNAGAEVVELNGVRLVTSTWFTDENDAIVVDGTTLTSPYEWTVIGDPETMDRALEIPGGALATVRTAGAEAATTRRDQVEITAVREPSEPKYATPQPRDE